MGRVQAPQSRPLAANHVSNVPPDKQATWPLDQQYIIAGLNVKEKNDGYHATTWYSVTGGSSFSVPPFTTAVPATPDGGRAYPVGMPLYGNVGTDEEGWAYDPSTRQWYKDVPDIAGTGAVGSTVTGPALPPGPSSGGVPTAKATQSIEFSLEEGGDGFWIARTPAASAAMKDGNPHPGISIINPGEWERVAGGMSKREALSLDEFKDAGWKGLDRQFLAWQGTDSQPAGEELASAMTEAMKGDKGAQRALRAVGISPPDGGYDSAGDSDKGIFGSLGINF